jgi:hypothetical protein
LRKIKINKLNAQTVITTFPTATSSRALMTSRAPSNDTVWWMLGLHETEKYNIL